MNARNIADINKPGVVMIQTIFQGDIRCPEIEEDEAAVKELEDLAIWKYENGEFASLDEYVNFYLSNLFGNVEAYFKPSTKYTEESVQTGAIGTGFIITSDGYIMTNAHVVSMRDEELKFTLGKIYIENSLAETGMAKEQLLETFRQQGANVSGELVDELFNGIVNYFFKYMEIKNVQTSVFIGMGMVIPGVEIVQKGFTANIITKGEPTPGKDVAIIKIDKGNLPTVTLGDDSSLGSGDRVYAMGYPGAATFNPMLAEESVVEPTFTSGIISARKTMPGGWDILQTDVAITHGNSGGPVFDDNGNVIGLATFGSVDFSTGAEVQGMNFVVPISVAKQFMNEKNIIPKESVFTQKYKKGISSFGKGKYKEALEIFREVDELSPGLPYVQEYVSKSRQAIAEGKEVPDEGSNGGNKLAGANGMLIKLISAFGALVVILIIILVIVLAKKRPMNNASPSQINNTGKKPGQTVQDNYMAEQAQAAGQVYNEHSDAGQQAAVNEEEPAQIVGMVYCIECGGKLQPGMKFCGSCGKKL